MSRVLDQHEIERHATDRPRARNLPRAFGTAPMPGNPPVRVAVVLEAIHRGSRVLGSIASQERVGTHDLENPPNDRARALDNQGGAAPFEITLGGKERTEPG